MGRNLNLRTSCKEKYAFKGAIFRGNDFGNCERLSARACLLLTIFTFPKISAKKCEITLEEKKKNLHADTLVQHGYVLWLYNDFNVKLFKMAKKSNEKKKTKWKENDKYKTEWFDIY